MLTHQSSRSRGVLLALRNAASFYQGGKVVNVAGPGKQLCAPFNSRYGSYQSSESHYGLSGAQYLTWIKAYLYTCQNLPQRGMLTPHGERLNGHGQTVPHLPR